MKIYKKKAKLMEYEVPIPIPSVKLWIKSPSK